MNTLSASLFTTISTSTSKELTTTVNETIALELNNSRPFTPADLWNVQRRSRTLLQRRRNA